MLPRGLAHPIVFAGPDAMRAAGGSGGEGEEDQQRQQPAFPPLFGGGDRDHRRKEQSDSDNSNGNANFGSLLSTYGAVPVSAFNMHKLLANGESVLLYPGGAREAFKRKGENYQLIWPQKAEFVRLAAKFGATIVPVSAIGADEGVVQLLDIDEVNALSRALPFGGAGGAGRDAERQRARIPAARVGVNAVEEVADVDAFGLPLIAPAVPRRFYFLFGRPIETAPELAADRAACQALYGDVKAAVEGGLAYLLRKREADPYGDFWRRVTYEASWNFERQAPSFEP